MLAAYAKEDVDQPRERRMSVMSQPAEVSRFALFSRWTKKRFASLLFLGAGWSSEAPQREPVVVYVGQHDHEDEEEEPAATRQQREPSFDFAPQLPPPPRQQQRQQEYEDTPGLHNNYRSPRHRLSASSNSSNRFQRLSSRKMHGQGV